MKKLSQTKKRRKIVSAIALSAILIGSMTGAMAAKPPKSDPMKPIPRPTITERKRGENKPIILNPDGTVSRQKAPDAAEGTAETPPSTQAPNGSRTQPIFHGRTPAATPSDTPSDTPPSTERKRGENKPIILNPDGTVSRQKVSSKGGGKNNTALLAVGILGALAGIVAATSDGRPASP